MFRRKPSTTPPAQTPRQRRISRRQFLIGSGAVGAGLVIYFTINPPNLGMFAPPSDDPNAWLRIGPDGRVKLFVAKIDMGQAAPATLAQIVADELDAPLDTIDLVSGDTAQVPVDSMGTAGSLSISTLYPVLRQAAAEARAALKELAAARWGVSPNQVRTEAGQALLASDDNKTLSYGELAGTTLRVRKLGTAAPLKSPTDFKLIGTDAPRIDIPAKVNGTAQYGFDVSVPNMLHGKILRPPVIGATLLRADGSNAQQLPGVVAVVQDGSFVGVVAERDDQALAALSMLDVEWQQPDRLLQTDDILAILADEGTTRDLRNQGDSAAALRGSVRTLSATYTAPFGAHLTMEPPVAVADVRPDAATIYASTQSPFALVGRVADLVGLRSEQVRVIAPLLGGGYGRKAITDVALEAARLSKAVGRPVRVAWSRAEEFQNGFLRPPVRAQFQGGLDAQGRVTAWVQDSASGPVLFPFFPAAFRLILGADIGARRGAEIPYNFANQRITFHQHDLPIATGPWRGLGIAPNCFTTESFLDELAAAAGADPLSFRLQYLGPEQERLRRVLETAAERAGWQASPAPSGRGQGIACGIDANSYVAEVAEVEVAPDGTVRLKRVVAAIDCGLAVNPQNVQAQVEGAVIMGASMALREVMGVVDGRITPTTIRDYAPLRIGDAPDIEVIVMQNRDLPPSGVGEPPIMPIAAAIANAIYDAVGARVRDLPMTAERVRAAMG